MNENSETKWIRPRSLLAKAKNLLARLFLWGSVVGIIYKTESWQRFSSFLQESYAQLQYLLQIFASLAEGYLIAVKIILQPIFSLLQLFNIQLPMEVVEGIPGAIALSLILMKRFSSRFPKHEVYYRHGGAVSLAELSANHGILGTLLARHSAWVYLSATAYLLYVVDLMILDSVLKSGRVIAATFLSALIIVVGITLMQIFAFFVVLAMRLLLASTPETQVYYRKNGTVRYYVFKRFWRSKKSEDVKTEQNTEE